MAPRLVYLQLLSVGYIYFYIEKLNQMHLVLNIDMNLDMSLVADVSFQVKK